MIKEKTLLILGAGASFPYGYPTAIGLRKFIITEFRNRYSTYLHQIKVPQENLNLEISKYDQIIEEFKASSTDSFDLYLTRNRDKYYDIGKFLLSWCILWFEQNSDFNEDMTDSNLDWYSKLYKEMTNGIYSSSELEKFKENELDIITFNYDRSLEEFLFRSLFFSFTGGRGQVADLVKGINIFHVYGKICNLQWEDPMHGQKYSTNNVLDLAYDLRNNIQIIYDERKGEIEKIAEMIKSAEKIFFLGFGYSQENLEALGLQSLLNSNQYIYGSAYKSTEAERTKIKRLLHHLNPALSDNHIKIQDLDCVGMWREYF